MANFDNASRSAVGGVTQIVGTAGADTITLSSTFLLMGTTSGLISGGGGTDVLNLQNANIRSTAVTGIEATRLRYGASIDAETIDDLGTITLDPATYFDGTYRYANVYLSGDDGDTADFGGLVLGDGERLYVSANGFTDGDAVTVDFSGGSFTGSAFITYAGNYYADETVTGGTGDDIMDASSGDDALFGGAGNDSLTSGSGRDSLHGGIGDDLIDFNYATAGSLANGGDGDDRIEISSTFRDSTISGGAGIDTLLLQSADLRGTAVSGIEATALRYGNTLDAETIDDLGTITLDPATHFDGTYVYANLYVHGANGDTADFSDLVLADGQRLYVSADGFADGEAFTADFSGGSFTGSAFITYAGNYYADETVTGGTGNDVMDASSGDDALFGGAGNDSLTSGSGRDSLHGGIGDDLIDFNYATAGSLANGGDGDDRIEISSTFRDSTISGGAGIDTMLLQSADLRGTAVSGIEATALRYGNTLDAETIDDLGTITLDPATHFDGTYVYANLYVHGANGDTADFSDLVLADGQRLYVSADGFADGEAFTADFSGGSFTGSAFITYAGNYYADETVTGGTGNDVMDASSGDDALFGGAGNDSLTSGSGRDSLHGGTGDDLIDFNYASAGSLADGGDGDDRIEISSTFRDSTLSGGAGIDTMLLQSADLRGTAVSGIEATALRYGNTLDAETIDDLGTITIDPVGWNSGTYVYANIELYSEDGDSADFGALALADAQVLNVWAYDFADGEAFTADFSAASFAGSSRISYQGNYYGDETVTGGSGDDTIVGAGGDDLIRGGA
ncbi:beta strand repeat-containing protein, partial [Frigidibacter sp. MR17.24]|uniref:beta strand repeat-containing protein n=1 Tax=Frigidibacter sp. MR17.24 TaxID=3127345 RepID=UPI003012A203